jgi:hypothetical protein
MYLSSTEKFIGHGWQVRGGKKECEQRLHAAGVTVRYGEELDALLPSVLDRAFKGEL